MKKSLKSLIFIVLIMSLLTQVNIGQSRSNFSPIAEKRIVSKTVATDEMIKVNINVTAPGTHDLPEFTVIIIKLNEIASNLPVSIDSFGMNTPESTDDIKWNAAYVTYEGSLIPSQVDDVDGITGFSENDELLFALPESVNLAIGQSAQFIVYFSLLDLDLPPPYFPEVCSLIVYPKLKAIDDLHSDMIDPNDGAYYIGNEIIQGAVLIAAAWSSGTMYELSLLDDQGESRWDIIKQRRDPPPIDSQVWKWSRFARFEEFTSQNQYATRPYPGKLVELIPGPIRARITVQSTQPYVKGVFGGPTTQIDIFGLFTYDVYVNQPYLDYSLDITGPSAGSIDDLSLEFQNREWGGGRPQTLYKGIYIPGYTEDIGYGEGWVMRGPDDTDIHKINANIFDSPWYLEALLEGTTVIPPSLAEPNDDQRGYGFIFDETGFSNLEWSASTEGVKNMYSAAQFPFNTRYHPFDGDILQGQDKIEFMEDKYDEYLRPDPIFSFNSSIISITDIPFDYLFVSSPDVELDFDNALLQVENITAFATDVAEFVTNLTATSATYKIFNFKEKSETELTGSLVWDPTSQTWGIPEIDVSSLNLYSSYFISATFETSTLAGESPPSARWGGGIDVFPPIIGSVTRNPSDIVRSGDRVNISASVEDDEGEVTSVILLYNHNGTWYDVPMDMAYGLYKASIPPQKQGTTVEYKITAYDDATPENFNTSEVYSYTVAVEYSPGQGLVPLFLGGGVLIAAVILALKSGALHRLKYDEVD
ncbi:hypothetical protein CEE45_04200 [Candidatus Heimdallarchaeota archaeon B3_Heim]|nr:MAG: hypothetical protein CEE45_04200 [Candidatus Heimdallarchaeota archaeon B3_Heim]